MKLKELLLMDNPELYDLKDERSYPGKDALEKMLAYKSSNDGFDTDGSLGKDTCSLIRELYRDLWGWQDKNNDELTRYGLSYFKDSQLMGPETMNSFATTHNSYLRSDKYDRNKAIPFASAVGRIGNMTLTFAGFNRYIAKDYWDLKLKLQYGDNADLSLLEKRRYINLFFHWDYVNKTKDQYVLKTFWPEHVENQYPSPECIPEFINTVNRYTERRGKFMVGLLRISQACREDYLNLLHNVLMTDVVFDGYVDVIQKAMQLQYKNKATQNILTQLLEYFQNENKMGAKSKGEMLC